MSSYRFCRTDDIGLLVEALNRCWCPYFPDEPAVTPVTFKRSIRDLQVWCSSCMVAFAGPDPIAVLVGAKRACSTLVHRIAVHPDHRRQGHGRHLLTSLASKLAILGPPRIVAEVPDTLGPARGLFDASGFDEEAVLTDYVLEHGREGDEARDMGDLLVIPVTPNDLAANGLAGATSHVCWERSPETLAATNGDIAGLAVASDEQIEAYLLYKDDGVVVGLQSFVEDKGARLRRLLTLAGTRVSSTLRIPKVHPTEFSTDLLDAAGFRPAGEYRLFAAAAKGGNPH
jgi:GNAT superfamily N-acetyltransferase